MTGRANPTDVAAHIEVDSDGRVIIMIDGRITTFNVDSNRMRRFAEDLIQAAIRKDMRG